MSKHGAIPGDRICSFIERVEHIDEEIKALNEGKKEVFIEAKGEGFDVKVLKENQTLSSPARLVSSVKLTAPFSVDDSNGAPVCASAKRGDASFISLSLRSVTYHTLHRVRTRSATYEPLGRAATGHCHIIVFAGLLRNSVNRVSEPVEDGRWAFTF